MESSEMPSCLYWLLCLPVWSWQLNQKHFCAVPWKDQLMDRRRDGRSTLMIAVDIASNTLFQLSRVLPSNLSPSVCSSANSSDCSSNVQCSGRIFANTCASCPISISWVNSMSISGPKDDTMKSMVDVHWRALALYSGKSAKQSFLDLTVKGKNNVAAKGSNSTDLLYPVWTGHSRHMIRSLQRYRWRITCCQTDETHVRTVEWNVVQTILPNSVGYSEQRPSYWLWSW